MTWTIGFVSFGLRLCSNNKQTDIMSCSFHSYCPDWKSTIGPSLLGRGCFAMGKVSSCPATSSHWLSSWIRAVWRESELGHPAAIGSSSIGCYPSSPPVKGLQKAPLPFSCRSIDWTRVMESAWTIRCSAVIDHSNVIYFLFFLLGNI